ncbi:trypsin-like serine peptidase [Streptantibioticus silvisoli]|uniref:V8-like Glu-specific endopeptidase n=1 Tax=Streptantibioticus silvisoli TaxID=2705255 RepID=A0ABT6W8Z4_9ACTN|nr:hypothetical protein [Streptantibioticus silvisoli]MDI5966407.1 hypothetical protein [Streptantibioticus silvisoli]
MSRIRRSGVAAVAVAAALAMSATACGAKDTSAGAAPSVTASPSTAAPTAHLPHLPLPSGLPTSLKDLRKWQDGDWKNWKDWGQLAHAAAAFANPIIKDLWKPARMSQARPETPDQVPASVGRDKGVTDPEPAPVTAQAVATPYHQYQAAVGKVFFDSPQGPMVCSGTVVQDPAHPGKSDLVWTAGHCVHRGAKGGWYRNIAFVPSYNDHALPSSQVSTAPESQVAPYGVWWADWAQTSNQWISTGEETGGTGSPYDYAILHVKPEKGTGKSLQETVGAAMPVWFDAPSASALPSLTAFGYPAAPPFDGQRMYDCPARPGRLSLDTSAPTEYRIGCTMTGGSSGGGWFAKKPDGTVALVSNTSIGPQANTWLAGPYLGPVAQGVFDAMEKKIG